MRRCHGGGRCTSMGLMLGGQANARSRLRHIMVEGPGSLGINGLEVAPRKGRGAFRGRLR